MVKHFIAASLGLAFFSVSGCFMFHDNTENYIQSDVEKDIKLANGQPYPSQARYEIENVEARAKDFGEAGSFEIPKPPKATISTAATGQSQKPLSQSIKIENDGSGQPTLIIAKSFAESWLYVENGLKQMSSVDVDDQDYDEGMFEIDYKDEPHTVKLSNSSNGILVSLVSNKTKTLADKTVAKPFLYALQDSILALK